MKQTISLLSALVLALSLLTSCGGGPAAPSTPVPSPTPSAPPSSGEEITLAECGLKAVIPQSLQEGGVSFVSSVADLENDAGEIEYWPYAMVVYDYHALLDPLMAEFEESYTNSTLTEERYEEISALYDIYSKPLAAILLTPEEAYREENSPLSSWPLFSGETEDLGTENGYVYSLYRIENSTDGMPQEEKAEYDAAMQYLPALLESLEFTDLTPLSYGGDAGAFIPDFETKDLDGNTVTNDLFAQKDLTVVNVWGTFCAPCISEMPELGDWMREMPDNVQLIGIVCDLSLDGDASVHDMAVEILEKANAPFQCLQVDQGLETMLNSVVGVPTTFLVDKNGAIVGEPIVGADVQGYKQAVEDYFNGNG